MADFSSILWSSPDGTKFVGYHGTPSKPKAVVALIHGIGEHSARYKHLAEFLIEHDYAFAAFDLRGHGKTTGKRGHTPTYNTMLDDIDQFLGKVRAFYPNSPVFLYGHSMGGNIVLNYFVNRQPVDLQGIVTTGAFVKLAFEPSAFMVSMGRLMRNILPGFSQKNQLVVDHISRSPEVVAAYQKDDLVHNKVTATLGIGMIETAKMLYSYKGNTKIPMLIMHGGADKLTSPKGSKQFAKNVKGDVTFKEWDGLFHEIHNEPEKDEVFGYLLTWLDAHLDFSTDGLIA